MFRKFIKRFVPRTHYWRDIGFDELSEIYASQLLRSLALSLVNIFVPVYLYTLGYSLRQIFMFFVVWFGLRLVISPLVALIIGKIGPKHSILLSMVIQIVYLAQLATLETINWPLYSLAAVGSMSLGLFWVAFHTGLSKVRHPKHAGKELSYVNIFERVGAIIGPIVGGLIANFYDPQYTLFIALVIMALSVVPLLTTSEPTKLNQKIRFRGFKYKENIRTMLAVSAYDLDTQSCQMVWPLFVAIAIFGDDVFGKLGVMAGLSVAVGLLFTKAIGQLIDNNKGGKLFNYSVWANAFVYMIRPFVNTLGGVFAINFINDPVTTAMRIPFLKGYHDQAETHEGYRIVFFTVNELLSSMFRVVFWLALVAGTYLWPAIELMRWHFVGVGLFTLLLLVQRFPALKNKKA